MPEIEPQMIPWLTALKERLIHEVPFLIGLRCEQPFPPGMGVSSHTLFFTFDFLHECHLREEFPAYAVNNTTSAAFIDMWIEQIAYAARRLIIAQQEEAWKQARGDASSWILVLQFGQFQRIQLCPDPKALLLHSSFEDVFLDKMRLTPEHTSALPSDPMPAAKRIRYDLVRINDALRIAWYRAERITQDG